MRYCVTIAFGVLSLGSAGWAQQTTPPPEPTKTSAGALPPADGKPDDDKFKRFDELSEPNLETMFPPTRDSLLGDIGGWRSRLADEDISVMSRGLLSGSYDLLQNNRPARPQAYNGQKATLVSFSPDIVITAGLGRFGLQNSKFVVSASTYWTTWAPNGPTKTQIRGLYYYQSFADKKVELKVGWVVNDLDFVGVFTGGNPVITTGLTSLVPVEAGMSADPGATPTINLTLHGRNGLYFKGGVQRSVSPLGQVYDVRHSGIGLDFGAKGASALFIGEAGIQRPAKAGQRQIWLRGGYMYNLSRYARFDGGRGERNFAAFALADYQIAQPHPDQPGRGIFLGATAEYAPPSVNLYSQYYELRTYAVGLLASRPSDSMTFNVNYSRFSSDARAAGTLTSRAYPSGQFQIVGNYSAHLTNGLYLTPSLTYSHHPAFGPYRDALTGGLGLFFQL